MTVFAPKDVTEGSFSRMTHAAGALASQAAAQAAELLGKSEDWNSDVRTELVRGSSQTIQRLGGSDKRSELGLSDYSLEMLLIK